VNDKLELGNTTVGIDGVWTLEHFSRFTRTYEQLYSAFYSQHPTILSSLDEQGEERLRRIYAAYPWRGGYSAVNFYASLRYFTPPNSRPVLKRVVYESPGIMELALVVAVALSISRVVRAVAGAGREANALYSEIHRGMQERKLTDLDIKRRELELTQEQLAFAREAQDRLSEVMGFPYLDALRRLTTNEVAGLKIVLSIFRRARLLGDDERGGNLRL